MKKTISVLLAVLLIASLVGCSNQKAAEEVAVEIRYDAAKVSYLGPEGTYTQEACETFFEGKGSYLPYETVSDAVQALIDGESNYAVIPQENTIGGAVIDYIDTLLASEKAAVVGEVELPISQNLLVLPGTALGDIKTVYSHKQGIAQGKEWLEKNLPGAQVVEAASTAEGAKKVAEGKDTSCAAIASAGCAEVYGLEILAAGIQNNDHNKTRFYVLSTEAPATAPADRLAFVASGSAKALPKLTAAMEKAGITLVALHDRPQKTELGNYTYVVECSGCTYAAYQELVQNNPDFTYRYLGSFAVK